MPVALAGAQQTTRVDLDCAGAGEWFPPDDCTHVHCLLWLPELGVPFFAEIFNCW
jgi:hypothetical protein